MSRLDNLVTGLRDSPANGSGATAASNGAAAAAAAGAAGRGGALATREMRQLENRLDKAAVKANEAISIGKTYEQVRGPAGLSGQGGASWLFGQGDAVGGGGGGRGMFGGPRRGASGVAQR